MGYETAPPVPAGLARYPRAVERWNSLWLVLEPTRITPALHGDIVMQYCIYYSDMRDAMEKMERGKLVAEQKRTTGTGDNAKVVVEKLGISPFQSVFDTAVAKMERLGRMIGLDPMVPLEATRTFADYGADLLDVGEDDEWEDDIPDDETNAGGGPAGDAGEPAPNPESGSDESGEAATEIHRGDAAGEAPVLDQGADH